MKMHCLVTNCDSNISKFDVAAMGDCLLQQLILVKKEIGKIEEHYLGKSFLVEKY